MTDTARLTRRLFMSGVSAVALTPASVLAQTRDGDLAALANKFRALSGFDTLPQSLVRNLGDTLAQTDKTNLIDDTISDELRRSVLKALYTGVYQGADDQPRRLAYGDALMYAAIQDSVNVPSYCGGVPGFWAQKPEAG